MRKQLPKRGSLLRPHMDKPDEFREVVATGANSAAIDVANAAALTATFSTIQEEGIADYLVISAAVAVNLVAGNGSPALHGTGVSSFKIGGNELIGGGTVPATLFAYDSRYNPKIGIPVDSTRTIVVTGVNNSGANLEYTAGVTLS